MAQNLENKIREIISTGVKELERPDLFREPLVGFVSVDDPSIVHVKDIVGPWHDSPDDQLPGARSIIAYAVPFTREVALDPNGARFSGLTWSEAYVIINKHFENISRAVADYLISQGYKASTVAATNDYDPSDPVSSWSHRTMACASGLGRFGMNRILITSKGSAVRYCSLLTDAELEPTDPYSGPECTGLDGGPCSLCLEACPVNALTRWDEGGKLDCQDLQDEYKERMLKELSVDTAGTCGKCIAVCPLAYIE